MTDNVTRRNTWEIIGDKPKNTFLIFHIFTVKVPFSQGEIKSEYFTAHVCGKVMFSCYRCMAVCVSVWVITFECLNIETSFLVWWDILTISGSSWSIKAIRSRSL